MNFSAFALALLAEPVGFVPCNISEDFNLSWNNDQIKEMKFNMMLICWSAVLLSTTQPAD